MRSFIRLAIAALAIAALAAHAEEPNAASRTKISDLVFRTSDLVFHIEDIGGKIESIAVKETATEVRIDLAADVLFDFDKADLLPRAQQTLAQAANIIRDKAKGSVRIDGYTDAKGSDAYNQRLSERRAAAVETWFKTQGNLRSITFVPRGFGAKNPVAPNTKADGSDDPEGRKRTAELRSSFRK